MAYRRYTDDQVIEAIRRARGVKSAASAALRCHRRTLDSYIARSERVRQAYEEERGTLVDAAQVQLMEAVDACKWKAVHFTLITLGRGRGYRIHHDRKPPAAVDRSGRDVLEALERVYGERPGAAQPREEEQA